MTGADPFPNLGPVRTVRPPLRILHLTDTHLFADAAALHHGVVDTTAALRRVLEHASALDALDLVVVTGDLSEDGSVGSYRRLRELVEPFAAERGATALYVMGNHDDREAFEQELGAREGTHLVRGFGIVRLDSSVPGAGWGEVSPAQLDRLTECLMFSEAEQGTVVLLHHPPVPASTTLLGHLELDQPQLLLDICAAGGVRLVLCGHYHHPLTTLARGVTVSVGPAVANTSDVTAASGCERGLVGSGCALVEIPAVGDGDPRVTVISAPSADDGSLVFSLDEDQVAAIAAEAGRPETVAPADSAA